MRQLNMDSEVSLLLERADNEILAANVLKKASENDELKKILTLPSRTTFYSLVIGHSYYAIFYSAKAFLLSENKKIKSEQGQHQQVYFSFKQLVKKGELDKELLAIYEEVIVKAETLLEIFEIERIKRGNFTYKMIPQANQLPAEDSIKNAGLFASNIRRLLSKKK